MKQQRDLDFARLKCALDRSSTIFRAPVQPRTLRTEQANHRQVPTCGRDHQGGETVQRGRVDVDLAVQQKTHGFGVSGPRSVSECRPATDRDHIRPRVPFQRIGEPVEIAASSKAAQLGYRHGDRPRCVVWAGLDHHRDAM